MESVKGLFPLRKLHFQKGLGGEGPKPLNPWGGYGGLFARRAALLVNCQLAWLQGQDVEVSYLGIFIQLYSPLGTYNMPLGIFDLLQGDYILTMYLQNIVVVFGGLKDKALRAK